MRRNIDWIAVLTGQPTLLEAVSIQINLFVCFAILYAALHPSPGVEPPLSAIAPLWVWAASFGSLGLAQCALLRYDCGRFGGLPALMLSGLWSIVAGYYLVFLGASVRPLVVVLALTMAVGELVLCIWQERRSLLWRLS